MVLCRVHPAGASLLEQEDGHKSFRWQAVAGQWAKFLGGSISRKLSACGTVLAHNTAFLMSHQDRHYPYAAEAPPIVEVLLILFDRPGELVETIWIIAYDETRAFDAEDHRLMNGAEGVQPRLVLRSSWTKGLSRFGHRSQCYDRRPLQ